MRDSVGLLAWVMLALGLWHCSSIPARGQHLSFSVDVQGPTAGSFGNDGTIRDAFYDQEIDGGDVLTVGVPEQPLPPSPNIAVRGPLTQPPGILIFGSNPGIPGARTLNLVPSLIGGRPEEEVELDALSFGHDQGRSVFFSVDEFSVGFGLGLSEQALGGQAAADIFRALPGPDGNSLVVDGVGGEHPQWALGLGLIEPNPPGPELDAGDNLDALDVNTEAAHLDGPIYFSLDGGLPDPLEQLPQQVGSAAQNGFSGADILLHAPDLPNPQVYLQAGQLGLHPEFDDVDALALFDARHDGAFDPGEDEVLFSVRRGSLIVGQIDSAFGFPISAADILSFPEDPSLPPRIVLPAEAMGMEVNRQVGDVRPIAEPTAADLDALSLGLQDGDMNCNFDWDVDDVPTFALALENTLRYESSHPHCFGPPELHGDVNLDGRFSFADIEDFVRIMRNAGTLEGSGVAPSLLVPEPQGMVWWPWLLFLLGVRCPRRH